MAGDHSVIIIIEEKGASIWGGICLQEHLAVIGYPIAHSLSPTMHNAGYEAVHKKAIYHKFAVKPEELKEAVLGLKALGFRGWNVTIPHKETILPLCDELTEEAKLAGAVNTVKVQDGKLIGHNTDGVGFVQSLQEHMDLTPHKHIVLLGAGGAAKGIAMALAPLGVTIHVLNRTKAKAQQLVEQIQSIGGQAILEEWAQGEWLNKGDCIIQTTSIGLKMEDYPFSLQGISPDTLVIDIIFNPWETPFLKEAKSLGCKTVNGMEMLLYQGAKAWEFWFAEEAPVSVMREALLNALQVEKG